MDRSLFTANFKRDYVAMAAVVIFFLIVGAELFLSVSIPTYFVRSDMWAVNMQRQQLFKRFDAARLACNTAKIKDFEAGEENKLVGWTLNMMANYLRLRRDKMSSARTAELDSDVRDLAIISARLATAKAYNKPLELQKKAALKNITAKLDRQTAHK